MDWNDTSTFLAVYRRHSLRAAGRELGVDQATVGRRLVALESALGAKLFLRTPEGYLPTPLADEIVAAAERMEEGARDMERIARGADAEPSGTVRIATGDGLAQVFVVKALGKVRDRHPGIESELVVGREVADLSRDEADLAVRIVRPTDPALYVRQLGTITAGLYASHDYVARRGVPVRGNGFAGHTLVLPVVPAQAPALVCGESFEKGRVALRANTMLARAHAAVEGLGLALLLEDLANGIEGLEQIGRASCRERVL